MIHAALARKSLLVLGLLAVALLLVFTRPRPEAPLTPPLPPRVVLTVVQPVDLQPMERISGRLQPARRVTLRFEVAGRLRSRAVEPGDRVAADGILLQLDDGDYRDALAEARALLSLEQAGIERDRRLLELAERNARLQAAEVERLQALGRKSLVAASRLDDARIRLAQLEAEQARLRYSVGSAAARLAQRRAAVARAERDLARCTLRAPFAGTVNSVALEVGDYVSPGGPALELVDARALDFYTEVRGEVARGLRLGDTVELELDGRRLRGRVQALQPDPDPQTFTHALRVRIEADRIRPGDWARAELALPPLHAVLSVPVTAVLHEEGASYVFRLDGDRLRRIRVEPGPRIGDRQVLRGGVTAGDRVVARDVAALSDGLRVSVAD
ncbi:efflux RND transporter periplasmic adaptor subunit [Thiohalobacter sp. IOR34]|uniref:efflux RND transporter periplasmic adaptor subunit n=1 Tax=Thiohalobacter sp. IOR34 TaxID=3057176 RepID=UPI0025B225CD|nr:efflux RND transporter periplasmic adaptor subunit [Thiohalobacter sp. IOR34]WJW75909.1 efflux RND transporter periplasmic adaptor subunit [Thiohalobacter sp. IOR34]